MDLSKRANLRGVREERGALRFDADSPSGVVGADWTPMVSLRADESDDGFWQFNGEASVVDHPYTVFDMFGEFTETIRPGAFKRTLNADPLVSFVYMHDLSTVMAQTRGRNLSLAADPNLAVSAKLDKTDVDVQRIAPKVLRGNANAMSFAFRVDKQEWNEDYTEREILEVNLAGGDVSIITTGHGANPAAAGAFRALDFDQVLRYLDGDPGSFDPAAVEEIIAAATALRMKPSDPPPKIVVPVDDGFDLRDLEEQMARDRLALLDLV